LEKDIDAIFLTEDNFKNAELINKKRIEVGFVPMKIITVPFVNGNDKQAISSERIRIGDIDRSGYSYESLFEASLNLPSSLRTKLQTPIGSVTQNVIPELAKSKDISMVITVGDIVSFSLAEAGMQADLSIVDFKTRRHELKENEQALLTSITKEAYICSNQAGKIENSAALIINKAVKAFFQTGKKQTVSISGEEDLLTLPAILFAPLGSIVIYGQYDQGAVCVRVTEQKKREVFDLIKQFS
jgi:uncharacterized protein (UPF0218 family)